MIPMYIIKQIDWSVLELTDQNHLTFNTIKDPPCDSQQWYTPYLDDMVGKYFLIVFFFNGKALQFDGLSTEKLVSASDRCDEEAQQWAFDGSFIVPKKYPKMMIFEHPELKREMLCGHTFYHMGDNRKKVIFRQVVCYLLIPLYYGIDVHEYCK